MQAEQRHRRVRGVAVALIAVAIHGSALAQSSGPVLPPSIMVSNYDRVLIGEQEALEAGAFVGRVGDSTSGWYNPAGMLLVEKTVIGGSATGFEVDVLSLQGLQKSGGSLALYQLPSFFGVVLGEDVIHSEHWRLGVTITKPISWSQSIVAGAASAERAAYSSEVNLSTLLPMISVAFAPIPCLRFGLGVGIAMTSLSENQSLSAQVSTPTTAIAYLRSLDASGSIWNLTGNLGIQWNITPNLVLGAVVRLPGLKMFSSGSLIYQNVDNNGTPWSNVFFRDREAAFDYKLPLDVTFGLGWSSGLFSLEGDVRFHSAISEYALFSSPNTVQITTTGPTGLPVYTTQPAPTVTNGAKAVWNFAIGGRVNVSQAWSIHAGFYTDYSPTNVSSQNVFRSVNMFGFTAGAKITGEHLSGSFGLAYSFGSSGDFQFGDSASGGTVTTKLKVTSLSLLYAISYGF